MFVRQKKKLYKIFRSFKRSYIDRNILYYNKNKIQIQMFVLFPNIFETKQCVTYLSNRFWCHFFYYSHTKTTRKYRKSWSTDQMQILQWNFNNTMIRTHYYLLFWMNFVADNFLCWLFRLFYLRRSSAENLIERDYLIRILFQVYFDFA